MPSADPQLPARVALADEVVWQSVEGQVVLMAGDGETYLRLGDVGSRMWEILDEDGDVAAAIPALLREFRVDEDTLRRDLAAFLADLQQRSLVAFT